MRHHAASWCLSIAVGIHLDVEKAVMVVLIDVRMVAMRSSLHRVIVG